MTLTKRAYILFEVFGFVAFALVSKALVSLWTWKYSGPITLLTTLLFLTVFMHFKGRSWSMYGLKPLRGLKAKLLVLPQCLLVFLAFAIAVGSVMGIAEVFQIAFLQEVDSGVEARFGEVRGNLPRYLMWLTIVWTSAAFGEEMFFRGYLITRLQEGFSHTFMAPVITVFISAVFFGYGHLGSKGLRGFFVTGLFAVYFGVVFLNFKNTFWRLISFNGVFNPFLF